MNQILAYFAYLKAAQTKHGIHSPFVYSFIDECLTAKMDKNYKTILQKYYKSLRKSKQSIEVEDHGAGSKKMGRVRKVSAIAKNSGSMGKYGRLLFNMSRYFNAKNILELGTSVGIGTTAFALGNPNCVITTIDGCANTQNTAKNNWKIFEINNLHPIHTTFENFILTDVTIYDIIYIDGHHDGEALLHYMNLLTKNCHDDTLFIIDDIHWSDSMQNAWQTLCKTETYHVSIELYRMGFIFRKTTQRKQHFTLRY
jgi:predicted O-methyltransferase YrrM